MSSNGGRAWKALIDLMRSQKSHAAARFARLDLTMQTAHALHVLPPEGMTMRALAEELSCDASNATGVVDRLEKRGLLERRSDEHDRRVKRVHLTAAGRRLRERAESLFLTAPPAIAALSTDDQRTLRAILERALAHAETARLDSSA
ncbi:MAG: Transcriptional regulator, MarR family [Candidatus Eremiobacteraeota bacterium]|nr:Transcriptional regulator, MarR family [Candidatus Eremiobacteraeota bacterium]